jgi:hypothetical protein
VISNPTSSTRATSSGQINVLRCLRTAGPASTGTSAALLPAPELRKVASVECVASVASGEFVASVAFGSPVELRQSRQPLFSLCPPVQFVSSRSRDLPKAALSFKLRPVASGSVASGWVASRSSVSSSVASPASLVPRNRSSSSLSLSPRVVQSVSVPVASSSCKGPRIVLGRAFKRLAEAGRDLVFERLSRRFSAPRTRIEVPVEFSRVSIPRDSRVPQRCVSWPTECVAGPKRHH